MTDDKPKRKSSNGRVAIIAAIFMGLTSMITTVGKMYYDHQEQKSMKHGSSMQIQEAYLRLREEMIIQRGRITQLGIVVRALRRELAASEDTHMFDTGSRTLIEPAHFILPDEIPYPAQAEIEKRIIRQEQAQEEK